MGGSPRRFFRTLSMTPRSSNSAPSIPEEDGTPPGCSPFGCRSPKAAKKKVVHPYKQLARSISDCTDERVPKGYVRPVLVGTTNIEERILVRVSVLKEPAMSALLEMAAQKFGYENEGVLRIPCDSEEFRRMLSNLSTAK